MTAARAFGLPCGPSREWQGIIDAIYAVEGEDETWLHGVTVAVGAVLEQGRGMLTTLYDDSSRRGIKLGVTAGTGGSMLKEATTIMGRKLATIPGFIDRTYRTIACETLSQLDTGPVDWRETAGHFAIHDVLVINGRDHLGRGVLLRVFLPDICVITRKQRQVLTFLAEQLGGAMRLRRRLGVSRAIHDGSAEDQGRPKGGNNSDPVLGALTARESQVANLVADGYSTKQIAYRLGVADSTVRVLLGRARKRLKVGGGKDIRKSSSGRSY